MHHILTKQNPFEGESIISADIILGKPVKNESEDQFYSKVVSQEETGKFLNFQVVLQVKYFYPMKPENLKELGPQFVYNVFDEEVTWNKVSLTFATPDLEVLCLEISKNEKAYLKTRTLEPIPVPEGAKNVKFLSMNLAIFEQEEDQKVLYDAREQKVLGKLSEQNLENLSKLTLFSFVTTPELVFFVNTSDMKIYSFSTESFCNSDSLPQPKCEEQFKFSPENSERLDKCKRLNIWEDRVILFFDVESDGKREMIFSDSKQKTIKQQWEANSIEVKTTPLCYAQQKASVFGKKLERLMNTFVDYLDAMSMENKRVRHYQTAMKEARGCTTKKNLLDPFSPVMLKIFSNLDGPAAAIYDYASIRHKHFPSYKQANEHFSHGRLYSNSFVDRLTELDSLTFKTKSMLLNPSQRVLSALKVSIFNKVLDRYDDASGFMVYELEKKKLQIYRTQVKEEPFVLHKEIDFDLEEFNLNKNIRVGIYLEGPSNAHLILQDREKVQVYEFKEEKAKVAQEFEALPICIQQRRLLVTFVRLNEREKTYEIVEKDFGKNLADSVVHSDQKRIIAICQTQYTARFFIAHINEDGVIGAIWKEHEPMQFFTSVVMQWRWKFDTAPQFPQFHVNVYQPSVTFNGRDYRCYLQQEDADVKDEIERVIYPRTVFNKKDFLGLNLISSLTFNDETVKKNLAGDEDIVVPKFIKESKSSNFAVKDQAQINLENAKHDAHIQNLMAFKSSSVLGEAAASVRRTPLQLDCVFELTKNLQDLSFDIENQFWLVFDGQILMIFDNQLIFRGEIDVMEQVKFQRDEFEIEKISAKFLETSSKILVSIKEHQTQYLLSLDYQSLSLGEGAKAKLEQFREEQDVNLELLKAEAEFQSLSYLDYFRLEENRFLVQSHSKVNQKYVLILLEKEKERFIHRRKIEIGQKVTHIQDFGKKGIALHTGLYIYEFFTQRILFALTNQLQFKNKCYPSMVNSDFTYMLSIQKLDQKYLNVHTAHMKETCRYFKLIESVQNYEEAIKVLEPRMLDHINPDNQKTLWLCCGLKNPQKISLLRQTIETLQEGNDKDILKEAYGMILHNVRKEEDDEEKEPGNAFNKALSKDLKGTVEHFLQCLNILQQKGVELNSLIVPDIEAFAKLVNYPSFPPVLEAFSGSQFPIEVLDSKVEEDGLTFLSSKSFLDRGEIERELGQVDEDGKNGIIETLFVNQLKMDFIHQPKVLEDFCKVMDSADDDKLLGNRTVEIIIEEIWERTQPRILKVVVAPFMTYFALFIIYISFIYEPLHDSTIWSWIFLVPCVVYSIMQMLFEVSQMLKDGIEYFASVGVIWNMLDLLSSILVIVFSIMDLTNQTQSQNIYIVGGFAVFCLWLKLFYFMRMFRSTAAFVRMIVEMFLDIRIFFFVFFIGIFAFSNTFYVFDMYRDIVNSHLPETDRLDKIAGNSYIESIKYVYLQSLGELGFDGYDDTYVPTIYWALFFLSTIFLQITLLNLLIAIMGDTFDRVLEVSREAQTREMCALLYEYQFLIPEKTFTQSSCIYEVSYENRDELGSGSSWEGKLGALKSFFSKSIQKINEKIDKMQVKGIKKQQVLESKITSKVDQATKNINLNNNAGQTQLEQKINDQEKMLKVIMEKLTKMEGVSPKKSPEKQMNTEDE